MSKPVIVIVTHRSGSKFLANLLESFGGYDKYPILIVVSEYKEQDQAVFLEILNRFKTLPVSLEHIDTNSFEFGGLYTAYHKTSYDEFLLLPHSCEILNTAIFDTVFETYRNRSVAFGVRSGNWKTSLANLSRYNRAFALKHMDDKVSRTLIDMGEVEFWQGHIGKYRRVILDEMILFDYLPLNMIEAITKSEVLFTSTYHSLDKNTVVLFPNWKDSDVYEERFGKKRLKVATEDIIKWQTHWTPEMVLDDMRNRRVVYRVGSSLREWLRFKSTRIYSILRRVRKTWENVLGRNPQGRER